MATSKGVILGCAAQAAVDSRHQVIVAADVTGSGSEQAMLLPMIDKAALREGHTLITADAGYFSDANVKALHDQGIPALVRCAASACATPRPRARARWPGSSAEWPMRSTPSSACAMRSIRQEGERCTAGASPRWSQCLQTSATTNA
jgi:hypothetical protein